MDGVVKKNIVQPNLVMIDKAGNIKRVERFEGDRDDKTEVVYKVLKHKEPWRVGLTFKTQLKKFSEFISGIYIDGDKFEEKDIIQTENGEKFIVLKNEGIKGSIKSIEYGYKIDNVYWRHGENRFFKVGSI